MTDVLRVAEIVEDSIVDGPGLRCTVFVQGCPHHCVGCHNPQTWDPNGGHDVAIADIVERWKANPLTSGLTLSGGEPTMQAAGCADLAAAAHEHGLVVWCYSGFTWERLLVRCEQEPELVRMLTYVDVLVDGPFSLTRRSLTTPWRGSTNQRLIDVPASLRSGALAYFVDW